ncbi:MAG TPA: class I SAM-dependent RNA methyltransferase [Hyphomicrobiaceae bacterium]|nr:class I SAM-dependent RNA methyltransferase [Hyphomicrobiaceae bacterium]
MCEFKISRLGAAGHGIAEGPAGPVYVRGGLPGEWVLAEVSGRWGRLVHPVQPSADRVQAVCPHFGTCGGCAAQHMNATLYRSWKQEAVGAAFAHRGLEANIAPLQPIPAGTRRRAVFTVGGGPHGARLGYREEGSHALVDIEVCPILVPAIAQALPALREVASVALVAGASGRMTVTATPAGLDVALDSEGLETGVAARAALADVAERHRIARLTLNDDLVAMRAQPTLSFGGTAVALPPGAFVQAVAESEAVMTDLIRGAAGKAKRLADLFCGIGTFTLPLARKARVLAVDGDGAAIAALKNAALRPGLKPVEARVRDLLRAPLSPIELESFEAVIFDPPRAGAKAQAEALARSRVPLVIAVSCNPATLARDARILVEGGYCIERVVPIDQFVFSAQVEAVAILSR